MYDGSRMSDTSIASTQITRWVHTYLPNWSRNAERPVSLKALHVGTLVEVAVVKYDRPVPMPSFILTNDEVLIKAKPNLYEGGREVGHK